MPKPVCLKCQRFYRMKKGGIGIIEGMPINSAYDAKPGTADPHLWTPYKIWQADLWECHGCGHELVAGFGQQPVMVQHHDGFMDHVLTYRKAFPNIPQINDC